MSYYVVTFERDDPFVQRHKFHEIGCSLVDASTERVRAELRRTGDSAFLKSLEHVEIYTFGEVMPGYEHTLSEWEKFYMPTPEYENFGRVYFLNELALRMYREGGIEFEVAKVISDEELPRSCSRSLSAPYLPKAKQ
ncbi:MAG TPA: hypothetical protein VEZ40_01125 [Pyrinomonadaceae bacterium]|nr:hypothetical protein [Pyrinomonadaceae bacterium]